MEPKVRFKGFEGEWIYLPFSEIAERTSVSEQAGILPGVEFEDIVSGEGSFNKNIYQKDCHKFGKVFHKGDILFGKLRPYLKNIILADFKGVAIGDFWILRSKDFDTEYLYTLINSDSFLDVANISSGSKMPRADWNLVSTTKFIVTSNKEEQQSIGTYFRTLDAKLQASAKKVDSLKKLKSASLVAMFPQNGESKPKVRFNGFEGEWSTNNLGSIFAERIESNENGEMLSVTMNNGIIRSSDNGRFDNSNSDKSKYKVVKIGDIAYNSMRMWQGASGVSQYEGIVSPAYTVVTPSVDVDTDFFGYMFKTDDVIRLFKLNSQGLTSDNWNLKYPAFSRICVSYPKSKEEQQAIAAYFRSLDRKIALETARLEKLKQIKLACLDKMFV